MSPWRVSFNPMLKCVHSTTRGQTNTITKCLSFIHQKQWKILQNLKVVIVFLIESLNTLHSKVVLMFQIHWLHDILLQCLPFIECLLCTKAWYYAYHLLSAHCVQRHGTTHYLQYLHQTLNTGNYSSLPRQILGLRLSQDHPDGN